MTDVVLGITLKADSSGFVGEVRLGQGELDKLGGAAKRAGDKGSESLDRMGAGLQSLKRFALGAVAGFAGFNTVQRLIGGIKDEILATERANANLNAVIRATGGAARLSADEVGRIADQLERTTLFDDNEIKQAASVLLTFRNIAGNAFGETLSLAADLAALLGGDLQGAVLQLGKALQDPVEGLSALRRSGISFSDDQRDVIKSLVETGRQADAMRLILDEVARQVGGVAKSQVTGLTGATNNLADAWGDLLKSFKDTDSYRFVVDVIDEITGAIRRNSLAIRDRSLDQVNEDIAQAERALEHLKGLPNQLLSGGADLFASGFQTLGEIFGTDLGLQTTGQNIAQVERALAALIERRRELLVLDREGGGGYGGGGLSGGTTTGGVLSDEEIKKLEERADLIRQFHLEQVVQQEDDRANAFKRSAAMIEEMNDATRDAIDQDKQLGETLRQELLTPQEEYNESLATYRRLLEEGAISQETFTRAVKKAGDELEAANDNADSLGDTMKVVSQEAVHALEDIVVAGGDVHDMLAALEEDFIRLAYRALVFKPLEDAADKFFGKGGGLADFIGSIFGSLFGGGGNTMHHGGIPMHTGGVVGRDGGPRRSLPAAIFAHAPRYHAGGMLGADEVPIVGKRGEVIGWPQQMRQAFGGGETQVVINNYSGQPARAEERQGGGGRRLIEVTIGEAVGKDLRDRGPIAQQMEQQYGLARRGTVRG